MTHSTNSSQSRTAEERKLAHYPSLELCKKLTEAGFPETERINLFCGDSGYKIAVFNKELFNSKYDYIFPSVMELLDEIPIKIKIQGIVYYELPSGGFISWSPNGIDTYDFKGTFPNALAEMWLWLKENNYLTK